MKCLFVLPSEISTGEAFTALLAAKTLVAQNGQVHFLASSFTARFIQQTFLNEVTCLSENVMENHKRWEELLDIFHPDVILFADYPLLFFNLGEPLLATESWVKNLDELNILLVTFDHLGYAQKPFNLFFGPPHLSFHTAAIRPIPERMHILLPCPANEPGDVPGRLGTPFKTGEIDLSLRETRRGEIRRSLLSDPEELLIFHSVPTWALRFTEKFQLPYYDYLSSFLEYYCTGLPCPVTVVSVNDGSLLTPVQNENLRILNMAPMSPAQFDGLLLASDLVLTENQVSNSLGKAICGCIPAAVLRNRSRLIEIVNQVEIPLRNLLLAMEAKRVGAIFPFEVFPIWGMQEVEQLMLFSNNSLFDGIAYLEVFGGETTRLELQRLLLDPTERGALVARQQAYVNRLRDLPEVNEVLAALIIHQQLGRNSISSRMESYKQ
jgi:hypothetical protein